MLKGGRETPSAALKKKDETRWGPHHGWNGKVLRVERESIDLLFLSVECGEILSFVTHSQNS